MVFNEGLVLSRLEKKQRKLQEYVLRKELHTLGNVTRRKCCMLYPNDWFKTFWEIL